MTSRELRNGYVDNNEQQQTATIKFTELELIEVRIL